MTALIANGRTLATEQLTLGMIAFQRTNSLPAAALAVSADMLLRTVRHLIHNHN
jgi:hypothetical protein